MPNTLFLVAILSGLWSAASGQRLARVGSACQVPGLCEWMFASNTTLYQCSANQHRNVVNFCEPCDFTNCTVHGLLWRTREGCRQQGCYAGFELLRNPSVLNYFVALWQCSDNPTDEKRCDFCNGNDCDNQRTAWETRSECEAFDPCVKGNVTRYTLPPTTPVQPQTTPTTQATAQKRETVMPPVEGALEFAVESFENEEQSQADVVPVLSTEGLRTELSQDLPLAVLAGKIFQKESFTNPPATPGAVAQNDQLESTRQPTSHQSFTPIPFIRRSPTVTAPDEKRGLNFDLPITPERSPAISDSTSHQEAESATAEPLGRTPINHQSTPIFTTTISTFRTSPPTAPPTLTHQNVNTQFSPANNFQRWTSRAIGRRRHEPRPADSTIGALNPEPTAGAAEVQRTTHFWASSDGGPVEPTSTTNNQHQNVTASLGQAEAVTIWGNGVDPTTAASTGTSPDPRAETTASASPLVEQTRAFVALDGSHLAQSTGLSSYSETPKSQSLGLTRGWHGNMTTNVFHAVPSSKGSTSSRGTTSTSTTASDSDSGDEHVFFFSPPVRERGNADNAIVVERERSKNRHSFLIKNLLLHNRPKTDLRFRQPSAGETTKTHSTYPAVHVWSREPAPTIQTAASRSNPVLTTKELIDLEFSHRAIQLESQSTDSAVTAARSRLTSALGNTTSSTASRSHSGPDPTPAATIIPDPTTQATTTKTLDEVTTTIEAERLQTQPTIVSKIATVASTSVLTTAPSVTEHSSTTEATAFIAVEAVEAEQTRSLVTTNSAAISTTTQEVAKPSLTSETATQSLKPSVTATAHYRRVWGSSRENGTSNQTAFEEVAPSKIVSTGNTLGTSQTVVSWQQTPFLLPSTPNGTVTTALKQTRRPKPHFSSNTRTYFFPIAKRLPHVSRESNGTVIATSQTHSTVRHRPSVSRLWLNRTNSGERFFVNTSASASASRQSSRSRESLEFRSGQRSTESVFQVSPRDSFSRENSIDSAESLTSDTIDSIDVRPTLTSLVALNPRLTSTRRLLGENGHMVIEPQPSVDPSPVSADISLNPREAPPEDVSTSRLDFSPTTTSAEFRTVFLIPTLASTSSTPGPSRSSTLASTTSISSTFSSTSISTPPTPATTPSTTPASTSTPTTTTSISTQTSSVATTTTSTLPATTSTSPATTSTSPSPTSASSTTTSTSPTTASTSPAPTSTSPTPTSTSPTTTSTSPATTSPSPATTSTSPATMTMPETTSASTATALPSTSPTPTVASTITAPRSSRPPPTPSNSLLPSPNTADPASFRSLNVISTPFPVLERHRKTDRSRERVEPGDADDTNDFVCDRPDNLRRVCSNGSRVQMTLRWFRHNGECLAFPYGYCRGEQISKEAVLRSKEICNLLCL